MLDSPTFEIEDIIDEVIGMARNKKNDLEFSTELFEIDNEGKRFIADRSKLYKIYNIFPWDNHTIDDIMLGEKNSLPRIQLISEGTGKKASMYLHSRATKFVNKNEVVTTLWFMPSMGTLINKKTGIPGIRGWKIEINCEK